MLRDWKSTTQLWVSLGIPEAGYIYIYIRNNLSNTICRACGPRKDINSSCTIKNNTELVTPRLTLWSCRIHNNHHNIDVALKPTVIFAVDDTYVFTMHNVFTGYMVSSTRDIMYHLMARYGCITASDIEIRKKTLQELFGMSHQTNIFFKNINDGVKYNRNYNTFYMTEQVLKFAYHMVSSSGVYTNACKDWCWKSST